MNFFHLKREQIEFAIPYYPLLLFKLRSGKQFHDYSSACLKQLTVLKDGST